MAIKQTYVIHSRSAYRGYRWPQGGMTLAEFDAHWYTVVDIRNGSVTSAHKTLLEARKALHALRS